MLDETATDSKRIELITGRGGENRYKCLKNHGSPSKSLWRSKALTPRQLLEKEGFYNYLHNFEL